MRRKWNCLSVLILHKLVNNLINRLDFQGVNDAVNKTYYKSFVHGIFLCLKDFINLRCRSPPYQSI